MLFKLLTVLTLIFDTSTSLRSIGTTTEEDGLINFAEKIYKNECKSLCRTSLIIFDDYHDNMANNFLQKISAENSANSLFLTIPLQNYSLEEEFFATKEKSDMIFLFLNGNSYNISVVVFTIEVLSLWNIRGKHLFLVTPLVEGFDHLSWLTESFQSLWERQVLRSVIAFYLNGTLKLFTYDPFLENYAIDISEKIERVEVFMGDIKNMYGYPLKGYYIDVAFSGTLYQGKQNGKKIYRGLDGKFLGTLADSLNATLTVRNITQDIDRKTIADSDVNINFMDALGAMRSMYDLDFICNAMGTFSDNEMDHIFFLERDNFLIAVPKGALVPQYLYLINIISPAIWIGTLFVLGLVTYVMSTIRKIFGEKNYKMDILEGNIRVLLNTSTPTRPNHYQERLLLVFWMYFSLIFYTTFNSYLTSALVKPKFYPDIDKFQHLYKTNLKLHVAEFIGEKLMLYLNDTPIISHLSPVSKNVTTYGIGNWYLPYMEQNGVIITTAQLNILKYGIQNKKGSYHIMSETLLPSVLSYNVVNEKIYYREFLKILSIIQEAGLHLYWKAYNYDQEIKIEEKEEMELYAVDRRDETDMIILLVHLQAGFMILILGYILGALLFLMEHIIFWSQKRRKLQ